MIQPFLRRLTYGAVGLLLILNLGAIRKNEDPITKTQTDPISYKDKLEETKDGVKGAPTPSFSYYGKEKFLVKSAVDGEEARQAEEASGNVAEVTEVDFEEEEQPAEAELIAEESSEAEDDEWWVEEEIEEEESPEESEEETDLQG